MNKSKKASKSFTPAEPWVEAFRPGNFTDFSGKEWSFSESDIQDIADGVQSQLQGGYKPPLVAGHPKHDSPRVGSVVDSKVEDGVLKLKIDEVDPDFAEQVQKGGFKYLSSALHKSFKKGIRHLGALGAMAPAIKGMSELAFGEGMFAEVDKDVEAGDILCFSASYEWDTLIPTSVFSRLLWKLESLGGLFRKQREALIESKGIESADKLFPEYLVKDLEGMRTIMEDSGNFPKVKPADGIVKGPAFAEGDNSQQTAPPPNEPPPSESQGNSEEAERLRSENAVLKAQLAASEKEKLDTQRESEKGAFAEKLGGMVREGRLLPAQRVHFEKLFGALQGVPLDGEGMFGEGDSRVKPAAMLDEMLATMPKVLEFGEFAKDGGNKSSSPREAALRIEKYKAEQEALGRELTFADCATELNTQRSMA